MIRGALDRYRKPARDLSPRPPSTAQAQSARLALRVIRLGPILLLALLVVGFAVSSPYFLTVRNIQNLGAQSSIVMALALGQFLVVLIRGIDISVGAVVGFSTVLAATLVGGASGPSWLMVILTLAAGAAVGAINGLVIVKGRLPQPLIVTLATLGIATGTAQILTNGRPIVGLPDIIHTLGGGYLGPVPIPVILVAVLAIVFWYVTRHTQFGRWLYAVGGNPDGAARMGLPIGGLTITAFVVCGMTAAVGGIIAAGRTDSATPLAGSGSELNSIIAVVIGGASLFGGRGSVLNVLVGALILGTIRNGLDLLGVSPFMQQVAIGVIVVLALEVDVLRSRLEDRVQRFTALEVER